LFEGPRHDLKAQYCRVGDEFFFAANPHEKTIVNNLELFEFEVVSIEKSYGNYGTIPTDVCQLL